MKITLKGDPRSTNNIYRSVCRGRFPSTYLSHEGKAIKEAYQWEAKSQWRDNPLEGNVRVDIDFYFKTKRRRDLDNQNKLVLDALTGIVYVDDSQIETLCLNRFYDPSNPRIEVTVVKPLN